MFGTLELGGTMRESTFLIALTELPIMVPLAFLLEFFLVGKAARALAFRILRPDDRPQLIALVIPCCICCIMCPLMSLAATFLFKEEIGVGTWVQTWTMNFPMALLYQTFYCGSLVRFLFGLMFREKNAIQNVND